jgi:hypothetical protein
MYIIVNVCTYNTIICTNVDVTTVMVFLRESQYCNMECSSHPYNCRMYGVRYVRYWYVTVTKNPEEQMRFAITIINLFNICTAKMNCYKNSYGSRFCILNEN